MSAVSANPLLLADDGYQISRSVRLRYSASAYFSRTPAVASNQQKWTWSAWVKRGLVDGSTSNCNLFDAGYISTGVGASWLQIFLASNNLNVVYYNGVSNVVNLATTAVLRDPSAWYHLIVALDTTQATASNRLSVYINGVQVTSFSTATYPALNATYPVNSTYNHRIGSRVADGFGSYQYFDGYLAEINFIDGQQLTPSSFGYTDPSTGVWQPKAYTGTYGTNGFYLKFLDNSAATATTIGKDYSGNGNNWTPNNISVTAGVTYDSMLDSPTVTAFSSNYATLASNAPGIGTISAGNLQYTSGTATVYSAISTISINSGKWYWEVTATAVNTTNQYPFIGAYRGIPNTLTGAVRPGADAGYNGFSLRQDGTFRVDGTNTQNIASFTTNDVIGVALDLTNLQVQFYKNGTLVLTQTGLTAGTYTPADSEYNGSSVAYNFGQRPFTYTPPSGFAALNTYNLPAATINNGATVMAASTYTGTGVSLVVNNGTNNPAAITFKPDFVWIKNRALTTSHVLQDSVRGAGKSLFSNATAAESGNAGDLISSFNSNGFTVNDTYLGGSGGGGTDGNGNALIGWQWQAGQGTTSSNTSGSITSTVSVNQSAGFSVVTYTGTGANATVGHGLGVAPKMVIVKTRSVGTYDWCVYHSSLTSASYYIPLNNTSAQTLSTNVWNATAPTSSVFSIGTSVATNQSSQTLVAYCWSEVAGYSKFGSYTGNGSTDGPFVYCGFRPRWIMWKCSSTTGNWIIEDTSRNTTNLTDLALFPNLSNAETQQTTTNSPTDVLSNGFKFRGTGADSNTNGATYIFAAFAENPFNISRAR